ncbi:MAG: glutamate-5-semialdehyde dehydrogenase [Firmicutes bacterium]|nr:glutamate-5-semialdehyde dehydrogenase [Bacillota bacterium]
MKTVLELGLAAKEAAKTVKTASTKEKNLALSCIAEALLKNMDDILKANEQDLVAARAAGMSDSMQDRLRLTPTRIEQMADAVRQLVQMEDPIGEVLEGKRRPNGLLIEKVRVPLGVIGIIFEARPNVTVDAATLCLKAGNTVVLRGGKEAINSNKALVACMRSAIAKAGLPEDAVCLIEDTSRESAGEMMRLRGVLDVLIPRGGAGLIKAVATQANVPVIETGVGNCHIYVDASADLAMAVSVIVNAKTSRPSVCNAAESLLVHEAVAYTLLPKLAQAMPQVKIHGCEQTCRIMKEAGLTALPATEEDYETEYLDYEIAVKVVASIEEARVHIEQYSTGHSEAILTRNLLNAQRFTETIDAAAVYVNASTRFTDGGEFGLGAEIGISTQKLHARGPMGLEALTSCKFIVQGSGQIR